MTDFSEFFQQVQSVFDQLVGKDAAITVLTVVAIAAVGIGLIVSVLGAKLWRLTLTVASILVGAGIGAQVALFFEWTPLAGMAVGAIGFGLIAHKLYRIWVGITAASLFAFVAASAIGYNDILPQLKQFGPPPAVSPSVASATSANVADNDSQQMATVKQWWSQQGPALDNWARGFWAETTSQKHNLQRNLVISVAVAGVFGLIFGIFAVRFSSVAITSLTGTVLLLAGSVFLVKSWKPDLYDNALQHPNVIGAGVGVFLLVSFALQMLLTKSDKPAKTAPEPKAA